jgi:RNA polymerase sigma-70 factor (sigma-E family)
MGVALRSRRDQSQQEFERFVTDHSERLLRTAYLIVWDAGEAEDLVQECLARVARRWPRVRAMDQPVAYARRILINLALDGTTRRNRRRDELALESDSGDGVDHAAAVPLTQVEDAVVLLPALGELPPRQRAVLVLRYFEDLTEAQTAELLGCSIGTVKSTTSHAFARLRRDTLHPLRVEPPVPSVKGTVDD